MKRLLTLFILITTFSCIAVFGQTPTPTATPIEDDIIEDDDTVLTIESRLIMVPVSITDGDGNPVKGLTKENFRIKEENKLQEIAAVSAADDVPLEIALLIDVSSSTDSMFKFQQKAAAKFLQDVMRPQDRATIYTIGTIPTLLQTRNVAFQSMETIQNIQPTKQSTAFFDTVSAAATYLKTNSPPKSRKVIIAITDGADVNSIGLKIGFSQVYREIGERINTISSKDLAELLSEKREKIKFKEQNKTLSKIQDADTVFYSINPAGSSLKINKITKFGQSNMQRFANETGGTAFIPKILPINLESNYQKQANIKVNTKTLEKIFRKLANELQSQYLVQYYSEGEYPENKFVKVDVDLDLKLPQGVKIRSRQGYFVKNQ